MKPKAITFDFWGTLFTEGPAFLEKVMPVRYEILLDALSEAGHPAEEHEVREAYRQATLAFEEAWKAGEHMPVYDRVARIFALLGAPHDPGLIALTARKLEESSLLVDLTPLPGVGVLRELSRRYPLALVSDTGMTPGRLLREHLKRQGLEVFQAYSFSDETGYVKPRSEAFQAALSALGVAPEEALHVGDLPQTDIRGAFATGYPWAVQYVGLREVNGEVRPTAKVKDHRELLSLLE
ncbi:MAG: HAD family hydrolase [Thermus sp.]|uniref:HAD family hydrolase n=1 Tax=unclassified Thermus TaxID=2619321 RepID=UPI000238A020|nr:MULTISPECIES: HAD family hydrolase [unclassified Thermus]AEV15573.1 2-haloalkanoic acid dehalogenase-related protein [Thermus sp. CCB_US3_UF1]MCS6868874.1 HAD family hydrolase [Thermus sp.]MCS7218428.1 HAD family hydrolase [Thermus sp.]MCX7849250.1 HAD family hydrolase [Thermus sp.]MDW8016817.1 HAD family hydrolase [Thermus sp.]